MHDFKVSEKLTGVLHKLSKKDKALYEQLIKKIREIADCADIEHYKNLRYSLKECKRVHIGHFVLIFRFDKKSGILYFDDFGHHDGIYSH